MAKTWPGIDIVNLYATSDEKVWNHLLTKALNNNDVKWLVKTRYGIQVGLAEAKKKNAMSDELVHFYIRLNRSLEMTMKKILRQKYPNPHDDPLNASGQQSVKYIKAKRQRDLEFENFLLKSSY